MAEGDERIAKWLEKLKSNDSEVKVDAINKLQAEFLAGVQPTDVEEVITALKTSLRIPNQHISTASMSAIASLFPVLIGQQGDDNHPLNSHDSNILRHALTAFFSAGGIVDRLGDNREKARDCAREALVSAGTVVSRSNAHSSSQGVKASQSGKGPEPPLAIFERYLRDLGFSSKVSRVREQSILTLVNLRRANPHFPLRPFLSNLVDTLEDSDGGVRDCARASVIEMFTAPTVTDGARADLKKEMTKKGVRKGIVDGVLGQLFSSNAQIPETPQEEAPPSSSSGFLPGRRPTVSTLMSSAGPSRTISMASTTAVELTDGKKAEGVEDAVAVYIASSRDLEHEFAEMLPPFEGRESEHNWQLRERAVNRVRGMIKGDIHIRFADAFMEGLKAGFMTNSLKTLQSLRTTVALNSCSLYVELVHALGTAYEPFVELTIIPLLRLGSLTKKIVANQTQNTAKAIILHAHPHPRLILPMLWQGVQDKNLSVRQYSIAHLRAVVETSPSRTKTLIETTGGLEVLEKCMKKALTDQNAGLRDSARALFWAFEAVWRERAEAIANTLDATARKQLDKAAPSGLSPLTPPASAIVETKKSSVAAAIAASRAKARQIAAAPPTLRHAATAHASTMASQARRPPSPNSPSTTRTGPTSFSPPPTAKRSSGIFQKSATSPSLGQTTTRSPSNTRAPSNTSMSPPSSPTQSPTHKPLNISRTATSPSASHAHLRSPPNNNTPLKSSLSTRSASPPVSSKRTVQPKRASGVFSSPKATRLSPTPAPNDTLTLSPHQSDDESLMRVRAPNSEADSNESLPMASFSDAVTSTPPGRAGITALTRSTNPLKVPGPVIEDDLRARAAQAESAAERLLEELSEPEETAQNIQLSHSLVSSASTTPGKGARSSKSNGTKQQAQLHSSMNNNLSTPVNKRATVLRQAAAFQDSPPYKGGSHSIIERLQDNRNESSWWLKRVALLQQDSAKKDLTQKDLKRIIRDLDLGNMDISLLKDLAILSSQNPVEDDASNGQDQMDDVWEGGSLFRKLLASLFHQLASSKPEEVLEYGLIVVWEMLENQQSYLEGRESELLSLLFHLRYANKQTISEASNTIRDALAARIDPVYGLSTTHSSLKKFLAEPIPPEGNAESRALSHAFGLLAIGKFILRLPSEILEDELPRLQLTLSQGLNDTQLLVREAAAAAITAAQIVLQDETYLFTMLASLSDEKKNLLTYLFDKHGARGAVEGVTAGNTAQGGIDRLDKEMRRLDSRTSTPLHYIHPPPSLKESEILLPGSLAINMSDQEGPLGGSGGNDEDLTLPKATVNKYVAEVLGPNVSASKESLQLILDCCIEFIHLVSSESNEVCEKESRKTISPDHVLTALKALGYERYIPELEEVLKDHKQIVKSDRDRKQAKLHDNEMTEEELLEMQQNLFAESVARLNNGQPAPT